MSLSIELRRTDQVVILELAGRLSVLEPSLRDLARALIEEGERYFVISLGNISYMDNSGLGQLCWIYTVLQKRGGEMVLVRPTARIKKLLEMTKLDTIFQSFESEKDAVACIPALRSVVSA